MTVTTTPFTAVISRDASGRLSDTEQMLLWSELVERRLKGTRDNFAAFIDERSARENLDPASATRFAVLLQDSLGTDLGSLAVDYFERRDMLMHLDDAAEGHARVLDDLERRDAKRSADSIEPPLTIAKHLTLTAAHAVEGFAGSFLDPMVNAIKHTWFVHGHDDELFTKLRDTIAKNAADHKTTA
ncbi:hypothetical protein JOF28_000293 [Leucobacter exalbidus]|uniref:Uncharacterized protein n=1 Tax=Leucobacter exalbidus TaxID=662960 RepID=A0A940PVP7_9MICO|nr:hypothetical protein [Leucobacter exalbidus]MBP1325061.1 hypothetical protein [Leucobacter exalbidus]